MVNMESNEIWRDLQSYDQLYAGKLSSFYKEAENLAPVIWPGMKLCPVCIFRQGGPAFLHKHPSPPESFIHIGDDVWMGEQAELQLFGGTQADINGTLTAINYYDRCWLVESFYAELFHEMHHVYQRNHMTSLRTDNTALLVTYPEDVENDALKLFENRLLLQMALNGNPQPTGEMLNLLFSCREKRKGIIGNEYMETEKLAESVEGPATYCQYKYLQSRAAKAWDRTLFAVSKQADFLSELSKLSFGRRNLRLRLLMTGLAQCLILDNNNIPDWEQEYFDSDVLLNDFLFSRFPVKQVAIPDIDHLRAYSSYHLKNEKEEHQKHLHEFRNQNGICVEIAFKGIPECRGIDPMNIESVDENTLIHNTMLKLGKADNYLSFLTGGVISEIIDDLWQVSSVTFFLLSREQLKTENGTVIVNLGGRQLNWRGEIVNESERIISLELE
ncbi:MAG: hypothetical protein K8S24_12505 [Candidatus Aegiribacteria sp.]|nr:hypothetical protein [Candidatus Aegiribacteria sp.]